MHILKQDREKTENKKAAAAQRTATAAKK